MKIQGFTVTVLSKLACSVTICTIFLQILIKFVEFSHVPLALPHYNLTVPSRCCTKFLSELFPKYNFAMDPCPFETQHTISLHYYQCPLCASQQLSHLDNAYLILQCQKYGSEIGQPLILKAGYFYIRRLLIAVPLKMCRKFSQPNRFWLAKF